MMDGIVFRNGFINSTKYFDRLVYIVLYALTTGLSGIYMLNCYLVYEFWVTHKFQGL